MFNDTTKVIVNYAGALVLEYAVRLVNFPQNDVVDDTLSSEDLLTRTPPGYLRYIEVAKLCGTGCALLLCQMLSMGGWKGKTLEVWNVDSSAL